MACATSTAPIQTQTAVNKRRLRHAKPRANKVMVFAPLGVILIPIVCLRQIMPILAFSKASTTTGNVTPVLSSTQIAKISRKEILVKGLTNNNGRCDRCPEPDPDCEAEPAAEPEHTDLCELFAAYGNGTCDPLCPRPDPDCQNSVSPSDSQGNTANGTASDGSGSTTPMEDANSDGDTDLCEVLGWYDDNECDTVCKRPDPACGP